MISPSDLTDPGMVRDLLPPALLHDVNGAAPQVVRLEFLTLEPRRSGTDVDTNGDVPAVRLETHTIEDSAALDRRMQSERLHAEVELESAFERGRVEGRDEVADEFEQRIANERVLVHRACQSFRLEREGYFAAVEAEVVKLALAIAARVLHREAKLDPMLLRGVVKVALESAMEESDTVLRVPMQDVTAWHTAMQEQVGEELEITGDAKLTEGECALQTRVGIVELGVAAQLEEIEKGFFDLLQQRPG